MSNRIFEVDNKDIELSNAIFNTPLNDAILIQDSSISGGSSVIETYFNVVCVTAGIGILNLPKSVATGGWVSIIFIFVSAFMAVYTSRLLIQCLYVNPNKKLETYPQIGYEAFGAPGRLMIQTCHYSILLGGGTLCILVSGLMAHSVGNYFGLDVKQSVWILCSGILIGIPYCLLRTMREFVWMAIFGFLTTLLTLIMVVVLSLINLSEASFQPPIHNTVRWEGIPTALAVFSLAYAGNVVHPHLESAMNSPKKWPRALSAGLGTICLFYLIMSVVGYYVYGHNAQDLIFDNLPNSFASMTPRVFITIHVLMTGPILLCSFGLDFENILGINPEIMGERKSNLLRIPSRALTVVLLTLLAVYVPYFMELMEIIGAFFNCLNLFHFPIFCHVKLFGLRSRSYSEYVAMLTTLIIATICFVCGGFNAISNLIIAISKS